MKNLTIIYFILASSLFPQTQFNKFINNVNLTSSISEKDSIVSEFMSYTIDQGIPLIEEDTATFILRGTDINSVSIAGDITKGGEEANPLINLPGTDFWYLRKHLLPTTRLDYFYAVHRWEDGFVKLFAELDPFNPAILPWGDLGQINELAMPGFEQPREIIYNENIPHGKLENFTLLNIATEHNINVYLPPDYDANQNYPVTYFHDGSFYIYSGSAVNVIDNLIYENRIKPIIAVFVDPEPGNRYNNYVKESDNFIDFFNNVVVKHIDENYSTIQSAEGRAMIGLSFGGNIAPLIVNSEKGVYGYCGLHSGAFWPLSYKAQDKMLENDWGIKYYAIWGIYEPKLMIIGRDLRDKMAEKNYPYFEWEEHPQGHSMGFWRAKIDEFLEHFFPAENVTSVREPNEIDFSFSLFQNYPNPFNPVTSIKYQVASITNVIIKIHDTLGREVATLVNEQKSPGEYSVNFNAENLSSGIYYYSLNIDGRQISKKMVLLK